MLKNWLSCIIGIEGRFKKIDIRLDDIDRASITDDEIMHMKSRLKDMEKLALCVEKNISQIERLGALLEEQKKENDRLRELVKALESKISVCATNASNTAGETRSDSPSRINEPITATDSGDLFCKSFMVERTACAFELNYSRSDLEQYIQKLCDTSELTEELSKLGSEGESCGRMAARYIDLIKRRIVGKDYFSSDSENAAASLMDDVIREMSYQFMSRLVLQMNARSRNTKAWDNAIEALNRYLSQLGFYTKPVLVGTTVNDLELDMEFTAEDIDSQALDGVVKSVEVPAYYVDYPIGDEIITSCISGKCTVYCYREAK